MILSQFHIFLQISKSAKNQNQYPHSLARNWQSPEDTNNLIKTIRRKSYGIPDTRYFFLKIMEASRSPYCQYTSHKK